MGQTLSGIEIKWDRHQVGQTLSWTNIDWDKNQVQQTFSGKDTVGTNTNTKWGKQ